MLIVLRSIIREYFLHKWRHVRELWHHPSSLPYQYSQYLKTWVVDSHASSLRRKRFRVACMQTSPISFVATKGNRRRLKAGKFPCSLGAKNEERESKTTQKMAQVKERGGGSCFIFRAAKTENPVSRSFFTPKPNGNACYAGYHASGTRKVWHSLDLTVRCVHSDPSPRMQYFFINCCDKGLLPPQKVSNASVSNGFLRW